MLQWWKQGATSPQYLESIPIAQIQRFFHEHKEEFSPSAVYRAKTWGRFESVYQLSFVDLGLMPIVEQQVGESLGHLIERVIGELKRFLGWHEIDDFQGKWLIQAIFWLISAKILHDKQVDGFLDLNLTNVTQVFDSVGRHYETKPLAIGSKKKLEALEESARLIRQFSSLVLTTTEALAHVYENTMISSETRSELGTHSTPSFLVDYIVGNLADWIKEIPVNERSVFEPACGHAAFLVSAMRLLTELLPPEKSTPSRRRQYLRTRLHGIDLDSFALELARLSLTLTDIPNPDGWDLQCQDMFVNDNLVRRAKTNTILLANPPFDNFTPQQTGEYQKETPKIQFFNKSAEMLWRTVPYLPIGGVFGVVLPQTFLHSDNAALLRKFLITECELKEVCLFPDKVFQFSDSESAIIIGRRKLPATQRLTRYRRVRERDFSVFRSEYKSTTSRFVQQDEFRANETSLRLPELQEVWIACKSYPTMASIALLGRGIEYYSDLGTHVFTVSRQRVSGAQQGFSTLSAGTQLHELPSICWLNLDKSVIRRPGTGTVIGKGQVLLNAAPVSRGPWRLKALIDAKGHPVTGNFITVRQINASCSLEMLWAFLNSPVANAYAYCHLGKRHNIINDMRKIPIPKYDNWGPVHRAAVRYLKAASTGDAANVLAELLLQVDSEVLKLYALPEYLESSLLALFTGWDRAGVPFPQAGYIPSELGGCTDLATFLEFEKDWSATNHERTELINKSISHPLTNPEKERLKLLQAYADYHLERKFPRPTQVLDKLEEEILSRAARKGKLIDDRI